MTASRCRPSAAAAYAVVVAIAGLWCASGALHATETTTPTKQTTTRIVLKVDGGDTLHLRTKFQDAPPTIALEFPGRAVAGSLPEQSLVLTGPVEAITTQYQRGSTGSPRTIQSLKITLTAPYAYRVRSEPGAVVVEIDHPASIRSSTMEVGLRGGTILGGLRPMRPSERFRAMQSALEQALPETGTPTEADGANSALALSRAPLLPVAVLPPPPRVWRPLAPPARSATRRPSAAAWFWGGVLMLAGIGGLWAFGQWDAMHAGMRRRADATVGGRLPSGVALIDGLVWQAFERQGYQLVSTKELLKPAGTLRIMNKEGVKAALLFVWNGLFFEKRTVEQFVSAMRSTGVEQGVLIAAGSFTVPAQRVAKDARVTLIGREQLMELLSAGATTEYFTKQLEQFHARLEESKGTLEEYAEQLDTLRRQRNEASWLLGEERAASATLETQLADADQQLRQHEAEIKRWEQEATVLRKQWEESQWYLGESRERVRFLERQVTELQEISQQVDPAQRARDEANWYLAEERAKREALEAKLNGLQHALDTSQAREQLLQDALAALKASFDAIRLHGERRQLIRRQVSESFVELRNGSEASLATGTLRDLSMTGIGLQTDRELPTERTLRLRVRLPGREEFLESKARVVWQQPDSQPEGFRSGAELLEISEEARSIIEGIVG